MTLRTAEVGRTYLVDRIETGDADLEAFLFSLGLYSGEPVTLMLKRRGAVILSIKDGRYCFDNNLAGAVFLCEMDG